MTRAGTIARRCAAFGTVLCFLYSWPALAPVPCVSGLSAVTSSSTIKILAMPVLGIPSVSRFNFLHSCCASTVAL